MHILCPPFPTELNETVICTNDQMQVIIPSVFFLSKEPPVYVCLHYLIYVAIFCSLIERELIR